MYVDGSSRVGFFFVGCREEVLASVVSQRTTQLTEVNQRDLVEVIAVVVCIVNVGAGTTARHCEDDRFQSRRPEARYFESVCGRWRGGGVKERELKTMM
jgi:hypothetical protein